MKLPKLMSELSEAARKEREALLSAPDPRQSPLAYFERYRELHRKNLKQFLRLPANERDEVLEMLCREAARLLRQQNPESLKLGIAVLDTLVAWGELSRGSA